MARWHIWVDKTGDVYVDWAVLNCVNEAPGGVNAGEVFDVSITVEIDGEEVFSASGLDFANYCGIMHLSTLAGNYWPAYVHHDPTYVQCAGFPNLDVENGYDSSLRTGWAAEMADPGWNAVVEQLPIDDGWTAPAERSRRWDAANLAEFDGVYGDWLLAKVRKVFPHLADAVLD